MKYLIVGLGNIGPKYVNTRHNIGFDVLDYLAAVKEVKFESDRLADKTEFKFKGRHFHLIKPTTFMNLSGKAVRYWKEKLKVETENILVIVDELALPTGKIRIKKSGGAGGHNGLKDIEAQLGTSQYPRLRIGIGDDFPRGKQVEFVLGTWSDDEWALMDPAIQAAEKAIISFGTIGLSRTMEQFNKKK